MESLACFLAHKVLCWQGFLSSLAVLYAVSEAYAYSCYAKRRKRFETSASPRKNEIVKLARAVMVFEVLYAKNPDLFERVGRFPHLEHIKDRDSAVRCFAGQDAPGSAYRASSGSAALTTIYKPLGFQLFLRAMYWVGTVAMRHFGYTVKVHVVEGGAYSVWTRRVPDTRPLVAFPGFGLGAVPYHRVFAAFHRTVHIVEAPNLGFNAWSESASVTPEDVYSVVRSYTGDRPHDIMAHSLGSFFAASYINRQQVLGTAPVGQNVVICDGFITPIDALACLINPFLSPRSFAKFSRARTRPLSFLEFLFMYTFVISDLEMQIFTKRSFTLYESILWREDYSARVLFVFCQDDFFLDVPYIQEATRRNESERDGYLFLRGRHGESFFGRERDLAMRNMRRWLEQP